MVISKRLKEEPMVFMGKKKSSYFLKTNLKEPMAFMKKKKSDFKNLERRGGFMAG
jgi:hypothetical protein